MIKSLKECMGSSLLNGEVGDVLENFKISKEELLASIDLTIGYNENRIKSRMTDRGILNLLLDNINFSNKDEDPKPKENYGIFQEAVDLWKKI